MKYGETLGRCAGKLCLYQYLDYISLIIFFLNEEKYPFGLKEFKGMVRYELIWGIDLRKESAESGINFKT